MDALLRQLFVEAGAPDRPVAIVALGGYGRRHLCLHSDIDLLVLFGGRIAAGEERFLRAFLHPLWDLGVIVGHQVREIEEFAELEADNPEFLLALLDARPVAGARALFDRLGTLFHQPATHAFIFKALLQLIEERHAKFNATLYQLEPDVKEAPGRCAISRRRASSPPSRIRHCCGAARPIRRDSTTPKTFCCASARCCISRPGATTTC